MSAQDDTHAADLDDDLAESAARVAMAEALAVAADDVIRAEERLDDARDARNILIARAVDDLDMRRADVARFADVDDTRTLSRALGHGRRLARAGGESPAAGA